MRSEGISRVFESSQSLRGEMAIRRAASVGRRRSASLTGRLIDGRPDSDEECCEFMAGPRLGDRPKEERAVTCLLRHARATGCCHASAYDGTWEQASDRL